MQTHEEDDVLLTMLRNLGVDLLRERELNFYFVFPDESAADRATGLLSKKKFSAEKFRIDPSWWKRMFVKPQWSLCVTRTMTLDEKTIKQLTTAFTEIAVECGGEYDGWEANVADDNIQADDL